MFVHAFLDILKLFWREELFDHDIAVLFPVLDVFLPNQLGVSRFGLLFSFSYEMWPHSR